jgi:hypothetical protein
MRSVSTERGHHELNASRVFRPRTILRVTIVAGPKEVIFFVQVERNHVGCPLLQRIDLPSPPPHVQRLAIRGIRVLAGGTTGNQRVVILLSTRGERVDMRNTWVDEGDLGSLLEECPVRCVTQARDEAIGVLAEADELVVHVALPSNALLGLAVHNKVGLPVVDGI